MRRLVSNFIALLILISIVVATSLAVLLNIPLFTRYERPPRLYVRYVHATLNNPRSISVRVGFENQAPVPFCVKAVNVSLYTSSHVVANETVNVTLYSPSVVIPSGRTANYDFDVHTNRSFSEVLAVVVFNVYSCTLVSTCACNGTVAYSEHVSVVVRRG